jgi:CheY-like chemotaxis protein
MNFQPWHGEVSASHRSKNRTSIILSVDDEPAILLTRQKILEDAGYDVLSAADGKQALLIFVEQPVRLVLLDYVMPGMDGEAVASQMKRCKPSVPILLVSASSVPEKTATCVDQYIDKGQGPVLLLNAIDLFLSAGRGPGSQHPTNLSVNCPVCGNRNSKPLHPKVLGMTAAKQMPIAYRCSDGHTFVPPSESPEKV